MMTRNISMENFKTHAIKNITNTAINEVTILRIKKVLNLYLSDLKEDWISLNLRLKNINTGEQIANPRENFPTKSGFVSLANTTNIPPCEVT